MTNCTNENHHTTGLIAQGQFRVGMYAAVTHRASPIPETRVQIFWFFRAGQLLNDLTQIVTGSQYNERKAISNHVSDLKMSGPGVRPQSLTD